MSRSDFVGRTPVFRGRKSIAYMLQVGKLPLILPVDGHRQVNIFLHSRGGVRPVYDPVFLTPTGVQRESGQLGDLADKPVCSQQQMV